MKGILRGRANGNSISWVVSYYEEVEDGNRLVELEVRPNRIDDLNRVGTYLKNGDEVNFQIEHMEYFPYRWAVPYVEEKENIPIIAKRKKKVYVITVYVSGFAFDDEEITCDGYDVNSSGYWYFWNYENNDTSGRRIYLGAYPISRTILHKIEQQEVEF